MFGLGPFIKEKPLPSMIGMGGGAQSLAAISAGYVNPGEWTRILNQPGEPAGLGNVLTGSLDVSDYKAILIFGVAGGGGGGGNGNDNGAGGGGGGSYVNGYVVSVDNKDSISYQIPGGGAGGEGVNPAMGQRINGEGAATLGIGESPDTTNLYAQSGGGGGVGGYQSGGSGNVGGPGGPAIPTNAPTATAGGAGGRNVSCDNPPDGGNPGSAVLASPAAAGAGGGGGGTWCSPSGSGDRGGRDGGNSTVSASFSSWTLPGSFDDGPAPFPMNINYAATGAGGGEGGSGPTSSDGQGVGPATGGEGLAGGAGGGASGGGVQFFSTGNSGYGAGGGGSASRGGDAADGGNGGAGYLVIYAN